MPIVRCLLPLVFALAARADLSLSAQAGSHSHAATARVAFWEREWSSDPFYAQLERVPEPREPVRFALLDRVEPLRPRVFIDVEVDAWERHENGVTGALVFGALSVIASLLSIGIW